MSYVNPTAATVSSFDFFKVEEELQVVSLTFNLKQVFKWIVWIVS